MFKTIIVTQSILYVSLITKQEKKINKKIFRQRKNNVDLKTTSKQLKELDIEEQ